MVFEGPIIEVDSKRVALSLVARKGAQVVSDKFCGVPEQGAGSSLFSLTPLHPKFQHVNGKCDVLSATDHVGY